MDSDPKWCEIGLKIIKIYCIEWNQELKIRLHFETLHYGNRFQ